MIDEAVHDGVGFVIVVAQERVRDVGEVETCLLRSGKDVGGAQLIVEAVVEEDIEVGHGARSVIIATACLVQDVGVSG